MQNSPEFDFSKVLDQTLYTYLSALSTQKKMKETPRTVVTQSDPRTWASPKRNELVKRLKPVVALIGFLEVILGYILLIIAHIYACDYNKLYATEDSMLISLMGFCGLAFLVICGMILLTSLYLEQQRLMWFYILTSTILCVYIFVLSVMKIHFALLVLERDTIQKILLIENKHYLLSTGCVVGILTLLLSVIHFIGNITVFTYYNVKFIQPVLLSFAP